MSIISKQAGAELGQAQLKLGLGFTTILPSGNTLQFSIGKEKNTAKRNMSSAVCALSMYKSSVCGRMCNARYVIFIMWNSISGLDACYHFRLNISCGGAVTVISHQKKISGNVLRDGPIFEGVFNF